MLPQSGERPVKHAAAAERIPFWAARVCFMSFGLSPFHACARRLVSAFQGSQQLSGHRIMKHAQCLKQAALVGSAFHEIRRLPVGIEPQFS